MSARLLLAVILGCAGVISHAGLAFTADGGGQEQAPLFTTRSDLVILHAVARDGRGTFVAGLSREAFSVFEDGERQSIQFFGREDAPATIGLLVDNSGSMAHGKDRVTAAAALFAETSHPDDEFFGLVFNDQVSPALPGNAPFTDDAAVLRASLDAAISARGRTAMYDAVSAGLEYVKKGTHERGVLVVISDGGDNASTTNFEHVLRLAQIANTVIYTIAVTDPVDRDANPKRLKQLAEASGGEAFRPRRVDQLPGVLERIARDIRHTYTIGYTPTNAARDGRFRRVRITAAAPDGDDLEVRTRLGYVMEEK